MTAAMERKPVPPELADDPPVSWLQPHAAYFAAKLRAQGHDDSSANATLATALAEELSMFALAYPAWLADPRHACGHADILMALAGAVSAAYGLAHLMGEQLDEWVVLKLRHVYADKEGDETSVDDGPP